MKNKLLLSFCLFVYGIVYGQPCDEVLNKLISNNSHYELNDEKKGFKLVLEISTTQKVRNKNINNKNTVTTMVHKSGFYMDNEEMTVVAHGKKMAIIMKKVNTIIESDYDQDKLKDLNSIIELQRSLIHKADVKTCSESDMGLMATLKYYKGISSNKNWIKEVSFLMDKISYKIKRIHIKFMPGQNVIEQTFVYRELTDVKTSSIPKMDLVYHSNGKLKKEFSNFQIIKQ